MDGIATFLLGGAVGAVLGYLASRKRPQQTMTKMPGRPLEAPPVGPPAAAEEVRWLRPQKKRPRPPLLRA